ncbi:MAG: T9SS type A sorting domain-containing protein [Bacteroidetes bacterium]|nr:T9SS type A sorting domain-containing protein [Bacteroidota bacterium]
MMKHFFVSAAIAMCLALAGVPSFAQTLYRSNATGDWNSTGTWQVSTNNGTDWTAASSTPTDANNDGITVRTPHNVSVTSSVTVDQVVIEAGAQVTITDGSTLTIHDGSGTDLSVSGTLQTNSTSNTSGITNNGTIVFNDGGTYVHNVDAEAIPAATWDANSTCAITGVDSTSPGGLGQTFGNFIWNCTGQTNSVSFESNLGGIQGNFTVASTGGNELRISNTGSDQTLYVPGNFIITGGTFSIVDDEGSATLEIGGNFSMSGGTFKIVDDIGDGTLFVLGDLTISDGTFDMKTEDSDNSSALLSLDGNYTQTGGIFIQRSISTGTSVVTMGGNFSISGGTYNISGAGAVGVLNLAGNFSLTDTSTFTETSSGSGSVNFTGMTNYTSTGTRFANTVNFTVNSGATLMLGESDFGLGSDGTFTLSGGGTLGIGHPSGIAISGTASNIRVTGLRSYSSTANYIYTGDASQVPGPGLPLTMNNLTFRNPSGTTFPDLATYIVNGNLTIDAGGAFVAGNGSTFHLKGNWTKDPAGIFNPGTGKFLLNGTTPQTMSGSTFYDLEINNAAGVELLTNETVSNILTLTNGVLTTGSNRVIVTNSSSEAVEITSGSINGTIQRTLPASAGTYRFTDFYTYMVLDGTQNAQNVTITSHPFQWPTPIANQAAAIRRYYEMIVPSPFTAAELHLAYDSATENENGIGLLQLGFFRHRPGTTSWEKLGGNGDLNEVFQHFAGIFSTKFAMGDVLQALPVQLASFTGAVVNNNNVRLDWRTFSEVNNYGFYVQRRNMGATEWAEIPGSFVPGHGTTNEPRNYTYTDITGITTATQYRLKQVDLDGTQHYTEPILVDSPTSVPETAPMVFALSQNYPNPFNPSTEIMFTVEITGRATLDVYNALGQKVATLFDGIAEAGQYNRIQFNASGMASGVYFYRLVSGQKSDLKKLMLLK